MVHPHRILVSLTLLLVASSAFAGPVTYQSGTINVSYFDSTLGGVDETSFTVTAPGSATERYDGTALVNEPTGRGNNRGDSGATYDIVDLPHGATFDVTIFHSNEGVQESTTGGTIDFDVNFTTDRPLNYVWNINPALASQMDVGANDLSFLLDQLTEGLIKNSSGDFSGSLITEEGEPKSKTIEGTLLDGAHALSLHMNINNLENTARLHDTRAAISLTLREAEGPPVIPLPPGVWSGLLTMFVAALPSGIRRLRRASVPPAG